MKNEDIIKKILEEEKIKPLKSIATMEFTGEYAVTIPVISKMIDIASKDEAIGFHSYCNNIKQNGKSTEQLYEQFKKQNNS